MNLMDAKYRQPGDKVEVSGVLECSYCGARIEGAPFGEDIAYVNFVHDPLDPATDELVHSPSEVTGCVTDELVIFATAVAIAYLAEEDGEDENRNRDRVDRYDEVDLLPDHSDYFGVPGDVEAVVPTEAGNSVVVRWDQEGRVQNVEYVIEEDKEN